MVDPVAFTNSTPLVEPPNPLTQLQGWQNLANSAVQQQATLQSITNMKTQNDQAVSNLHDSLNAQLGRASLAHALYGEQTPQAYRDEIDRIVAIKPELASIAQVWKQQIQDGTPPEQLRNMAIQHASALMDPQTQAQQGPNGQIQFIQNGSSIQPTRVPGALGVSAGAQPSQGGSAIPMGLGPSTIQVYDPNAGGPGKGGMVTKSIGGGYGVPPSAPGAVPAQPGLPGNNNLPYAGGGSYATPGNPATNNPLAGAPNTIAPPPGSMRPGPNGIPIQGPMIGAPSAPVAPLKPNLPNQLVPAFNDQTGQPVKPGDMIYSGLPPKFDPQTGTPLTGFTQTPGRAVAPAPAAQAPARQAQATPFQAGPAIGQQAETEQNQQAYRNAQAEAATIPLQNSQYIEAHNAISDIKDSDFTTGIGSGKANKVRQLLVQLGAGPDTVANVNNAATAEKYLAAAIASKAPGSDARQSLLEHSNPSLQMPPGATMPIIRQIVASNRAKQAVLQTAPSPDGSGFLSHQSEKSQLLNSPEGLKALSWDMMPPADRTAYIKNLTAAGGTGLKNFEAAFRIAHQQNLIGGQ